MWTVAGVILLAAGLGTIVYNRLQPGPEAGITGRILPELREADRIAADPGALRGYNVLIISLDTTRADHLGCYGNTSIKTPNLDDLARNGVLFAQAIAASSSTLPSHSSLMTGLYPYRHGARANGTFRLGDDVTTLAERLRAVGYRTAAAISAFVLDSRYGLSQGFDTYLEDLTYGMKYSDHMFRERAAELTNVPVTDWLRKNGRERFFLWVHYFDPHAPYLPPEPFRGEYRDDPYDGEIAYADSQIAALLGVLDEIGAREHTLVIFTSDHGEGLGEHGEMTHSTLIYDATLHVPLIVAAPAALPRGRVVRRQVSLVDVVPTVMDLLGEPVPSEVDGISLRAAPPDGPRAVYIETLASMTLHGWAPLLGVRRDDFKYILAPRPELYDLARDPGELDNLYDKQAARAAELRNALEGFVGPDPLAAVRVAGNLSMSAEELARLRDLGYVFTAGREPAALSNLDPKDMVHHWERVQYGINLREQGQVAEGVKVLEECVAAVDGDVFAREALAAAYVTLGETDKAMACFRRAAELEPNEPVIFLAMASIEMNRGELDEAERLARHALAIDPATAQAYIHLGRIARRRGREDEAVALFHKAIEMDPGSAGAAAYNEIADTHLMAHRYDEARKAFRSALGLDALNGEAHDGLANICLIEGRLDEAERHLMLALKFEPAQPLALTSLASVWIRREHYDEAIALCNQALAISPKFPLALKNRGLAYRRQNKLDLAEEDYRKAIEYGPWLDSTYVNLAQLHLQQGREDDAIEMFRGALRANPYNAIALANLGVFYDRRGQTDEALMLYRRALAVDPDHALVHKHVGIILQNRGESEAALYHFKRSLEIDPRQPDAEALRYTIAELERTGATQPAATAPGEP